jgi:GntR family transcriptional regulator
MKRGVPKFTNVYSVLRKQILDGVFKPGKLIPAEPELERLFGVSRTTVRRAVGLLIDERFVQARQGRGTIVLDMKTVQVLNHVTSFTETLRNRGIEVSTRDTSIDRLLPPPHVSNALRIDEKTQVVKIQRTRLVDDKPIAFMINYLVEDLVPFIEREAKNFNSLYRLLEEKYGIVITSSMEHIGARSARGLEAELLQVTEDTPLLVSRRTTYSGERPIEYVVTIVIAEKYEYCFYSKGRPRAGE